MEVEVPFDPQFFGCSLSGAVHSNQEWFSSLGIQTRVPRFALSSALVLVGMPRGERKDLFDSTMGWIVGIEDIADSPSAADVSQLLRRLGCASNQTLIIAFPDYWSEAAEIHKKNPGSSVIFVAAPDAPTSFPGELSSGNIEARMVLEVANRQELRPDTTFLIPATSTMQNNAVPVAYYSSSQVLSDVPGGYRILYLSFAGALSSLSGGGSVREYLNATLGGGHNPPYAGWLVDQAGTYDIECVSMVRLSLSKGALVIHGFDIRQTAPGCGWKSRSHRVLLNGAEHGQQLEIMLRPLLRRVLNTVPGLFALSDQEYSAFTGPDSEPIDLGELVDDTYSVQVTDERGHNILDSGSVEILSGISEADDRVYAIESAAGGVTLTVVDS
ncbi:hypothetical protein U6G28_05665 [Actinomycetaceae bacterium MB13-C1-2]|nr:hypothetical protein U6G28_05665 [Actinomycetaceae bacterium MB13-C1-2]